MGAIYDFPYQAPQFAPNRADNMAKVSSHGANSYDSGSV
jgi:hypothetical protein